MPSQPDAHAWLKNRIDSTATSSTLLVISGEIGQCLPLVADEDFSVDWRLALFPHHQPLAHRSTFLWVEEEVFFRYQVSP